MLVGLVLAGLGLLTSSAIAGCGKSSEVVARVGGASIDRATVGHWTHAIELGSPAAALPAAHDPSARDQALEFLIAADWLAGETADRHIAVTDRDVQRALEEEVGPLPGGDGELRQKFATTGQGPDEARLEAKAKLERTLLRRAWSTQVQPSEAEIATFYRRHTQLFRSDRRIVDLIENSRSRAEAISLAGSIGTGSAFVRRSVREVVPRPPLFEAEPSENRGLEETIFAAPLERVRGPVGYSGKWVLFVVRKVVPGPLEPLAQARAEIARYFAAERQRTSLARLEASYRAKWRARTSCRAAFFGPECGSRLGA